MDWHLLGIKETKDKKAITAAYREKLTFVNPEDKPEEFMALRAAYEEAIALADAEVVNTEELGPLEQWKQRLDEIYSDLPSRLDVSLWDELLQDDVFQALDTNEDAENAMLEYFLSHYYLPQEVMIFLNDKLHWLERQDALSEKYSRDFVENIIVNNIRYGELMPIHCFTPGLDWSECEAYLGLYRQAMQAEPEEVEAIFAQMDELSESHPLGDCFMLTKRLSADDPYLLSELERLAEEWPQLERIQYELANVYLEQGHAQEALDICNALLEKDQDQARAVYIKAQAMAALGQYEDAVEFIDEAMYQSSANQQTVRIMIEKRNEIYDQLLEKYEKELSEHPDDYQMRFDRAWALMKQEKYEESLAEVVKLPYEEPNPFSYHNLKDILFGALDRYDEAVSEVDLMITYVKALDPNESEENARRVKRLPELLGRKATSMWNARMEGAIELALEAYALDESSVSMLNFLTHMYLMKHEYNMVLTYAQKMIEQLPSNVVGYIREAMALYGLRHDRECLDVCETAMRLDASDLQIYLLKLLVFTRNEVKEASDDLFEILTNAGFADDATVRYCKLQWDFNDDSNQEERLAAYTSLQECIEKDSINLVWVPEFYLELAIVLAKVQDAHEVYEREPLYRLLNKGLELNPNHYGCMDYLAWLYEKDGRDGESLELYHKLEALPRRSLYVEEQLANLYYNHLHEYADKSLEYYLKVAEEERTTLNYFKIGMLYLNMNQPLEAEAAFKTMIEIDPDDVDGYLRLIEVYMYLGRYEEATVMANKSIGVALEHYKNPGRLLWGKIKLMQRLGQVDALTQFLYEFAKENDYPEYYPKLLDHLLLSGRWKEAKKMLKEWEHHQGKNANYNERLFRYYYLTGDVKAAAKVLKKNKDKYPTKEFRQHSRWVHEYNGEYKEALALAMQEYEEAKENGNDLLSPLFHVCHALWLLDDREELSVYGTKLIEVCRTEKFHGRSQLIYMGHEAGVLAMNGCIQEARALLAKIRELPLCANCCPYRSCKDADMYEIIVELCDQNYNRALELIDRLKVTGPDEEGVILYAKLAERGKKRG